LDDLPGRFDAEDEGMLMLVYDVNDENEVEFEENGGSGLTAATILGEVDEKRVLGCAGIRSIVAKGGSEEDQACELKRMYIRPQHRRAGLGRQLTYFTIDQAQALGYKLMYLDSLRRLPQALCLYKNTGFSECYAYCDNPEEDAVYMKISLLEQTDQQFKNK